MKFQTMIRINGVATFLSPWMEDTHEEAESDTVLIYNLRDAIQKYESQSNNTISIDGDARFPKPPKPQVFHIEIAIGRQP